MRAILVFSLLGLSACASIGFDRDARSGYSESETSTSDSVHVFYDERENKEVLDAKEELGYTGRPLSEMERAQLEERLRLHRMESRLESKRDRKQYYSMRSQMRNDRERMAFLSLPNFEAKQRWLQNRGYLREEQGHSDAVGKVIEANDIGLGMSQKAVRESWGDPDFIENAGDPMYGYERWNYHRFTPGSDGYQKENRVVYFEGGHVVGWETD
jgi:hypothetical protein